MEKLSDCSRSKSMRETKLSDNWETPQWLWDELNKEFNFNVDLCASEKNKKCRYYTEDYLNTPITTKIGFLNCKYSIKSAFMNPPYSNPKPFIEKAWEDSKHCKIVCLLPNTIKTCKYMDILDQNNGIDTFRKWKEGIEIRDLSRRTGFNHPDKQSSSPSFGCMVLIMDRRNV